MNNYLLGPLLVPFLGWELPVPKGTARAPGVAAGPALRERIIL